MTDDPKDLPEVTGTSKRAIGTGVGTETGTEPEKTGTSAEPVKFLCAANDNLPRVSDNFPAALDIVAGEIEILDTYLMDIVAALIAANDNNKP